MTGMRGIDLLVSGIAEREWPLRIIQADSVLPPPDDDDIYLADQPRLILVLSGVGFLRFSRAGEPGP
ncbi:MAG: hypothetical protein PF961_21640, partial [Planctomycetota bacterium]|nr:hypothetical protein [Planctomycetota bacterium]